MQKLSHACVPLAVAQTACCINIGLVVRQKNKLLTIMIGALF
jgi:hypothetical protein